MNKSYLFLILTLFFSCDKAIKSNYEGWRENNLVEIEVKNILFTFPASGHAFDHRDSLINDVFKSLQHDLKLFQEKELTDTIRIRFFNSTQEFKRVTGYPIYGTINEQTKTVFYVADGKLGPFVAHELVHLIGVIKWGWYPDNSSWLNEGLATYADNSYKPNHCSGYTVEQVYSYLADKNMFLSMDSLALKFYDQQDMISYHQSAYIVQYLIETYGIEKVKLLWKGGFSNFESIIGKPFEEVELDIKTLVKKKYPQTPDINWATFSKGCK